MAQLRSNKLLALLLVFATLATRAAIPEGFMPSAPGSGLLFELCPSAVPAEVMQVLQARQGHSTHAHHGHHAHAGTGTDDHSMHDGAQCPIGHLLASAAAFDMGWESETLPPSPEYFHAPPSVRLRALRTATSSRGPPA